MITVIGLGLYKDDLSFRAEKFLKKAKNIYVKTAKTPTYDFFEKNGISAKSFDDAYDAAEDFSELDEKIIKTLLSENEKGDVAFCVNGGGFDDGTVQKLKKQTNDIEIIAGVSFAADFAGVCPDTSVMSYSAYDVASDVSFMPDKRHTVVVREIDNRLLAGDVKIKLSDVYGDEKLVYLINSVKKTDNLTYIPLAEIDHGKNFSYITTLVIPPDDLLSAKRHDSHDLIEIMATLLSENGCPWDRAQTHESIRINLIEEAYELIDAIDRNDLDGMVEETGDVLLQAVFHAMIGNADGEYNFNDVVSGLCHKLITRHTHIFGQNKATNAEDALYYWNAAKAVEKEYTSFGDKMDKIPKNLPALLYAYKIQKVAVKCGFDWPDIDGTYDKLNEEIREFKEADGDDAVMEAGDLLFSAINPMRWRHIEPETALKEACDKFVKRFKYMESEILKDGKDLGNAEILDEYWNKAKKIYKCKSETYFL